MRKLLLILGWGLIIATILPACTAQNAYVYPAQVKEQYLITTGDTNRPYQSLGYLQITRKGALLFGFASVVDADLQKMFSELLLQEIRRAGADGIINLRFHETQYTTATKVLFAFPFFFVPLPTSVEITGELIKFNAPAPKLPAVMP